MKLLTNKAEILAQYKKQDFNPYQTLSGKLVMLSDDKQYYYYFK